MKTDRLLAAKLALILLPVLLTFGAKGAIAQITPANDGTGTIVNGTQQLNITGGTQAGGNLFHSFQQFGVNAGQTANFLSNPNTQNILGRVTGGNASLINGLLQVSGSNANLYLINPSGIVFGQNASLNVPAAFTATTANGIGFGNGQWFNAAGSNNYGALTGNPNSFGFVGTSGSLVNAGNLSVNPGQSIALVGGTVVNTGTISAPGGNITIAAIPGGKMVRIGQAGTVLSLDLPTSDKALINAPITTPLSLPALLTGGSVPSAMGVVVEDGVIKLTGGSASVTGTLNADGTGLQNGGNVVAYADNHLSFGGTISAKGGELGGNGGFVDTSGKGTIAIAPNAKVLTTAAKGLTGTWLIDPADLEVVAGTGGSVGGAGSTIGAGTIVTALNTTSVNLQADKSITVNAAINANTSVGSLKLDAPTVNLNQAIALKTGSTLSGTATTVNVGATGTVQNGVDVAAANGTVNLAAATYTLGNTVVINKNLTVKGAGQTNTIVSGNNAVGVFKTGVGTTTAFNDLKITQGNNNNIGGGGGIEGNGALTLINTTVSDNKAGINGGGIYNNGTVSLTNSTISGNSTSGNNGGFFGSGAITLTNSTVSGNTAADNAGGIFGGDTVTLTNSTVSGNTASNAGGGIFGNGTAVTLTNSTVSGNTAGDNGGGIYGNGAVTLTNSTVSGNSAANNGGGIFGIGGGTITNSTITNNTAKGTSLTTGGGGIYRGGGTFTIANSIVAGNFDLGGFTPDLGSNVAGVGFTNGGNNLIGANNGFVGAFPTSALIGTIAAPVDPRLAPLGNYDGPTKTHALLPGSLAINAGNATSGSLDQRGKSRVGIADIGAFESQGFTLVTSAGTPQNKTVNQNFTTPLTVKVVANNPIEPVTGGVVKFTAPTSTATATLSAPTATIDASGNASVIATANTKIGAYTVKANIVGITPTADFALTNIADIPNSIATTSGSGQTTTVDQNFANNLVATVTDQFGNPVQGSTVTFSLPTTTGANGAFVSNTAVTDADGKASIVIKANTKSGSFTTTGKVGTVTTGANFNLTNLADVANSIATTSGSGQTTTVDQNFANNLVATVTDKFGNPVQGSTVTFSVPGSGASGVFVSNTAVTDADGKVSIGIKANTKSGSFTTTGKVGTIATGADFNLTNLADVANAIATTSGSGQTTTVDQNFANNLVATVTDKFGNPVQGSTVTFSLPTTTGANGVFGSNTAVTDAAGKASIGIKANTKSGSFTTTGKVGTIVTGADFNLTNLADIANSIATTSGSGQTTTVDQNFANNLVATVTDKFGNPVQGSTVTFSVPGSGASGVFVSNTAVTDAAGKASIGIKANTKSGSFTTTGKVGTVTTGANFNLTNTADLPNSIATTSGSGQTTTVDQNFANNLVATVTDKFGNPVQGSTVTFSLPTTTGANGAFVPNTAVTDADGKASIVIKANTKSGSFTTTGKVGTVTTGANFNLTNLADVANSIATTSGSGQTATVDQNFSNNLVATVTDKFGNPVQGSTVTFLVPGSGPSGVFVSNSAVTDATGTVSIGIKANTKAGSFTTTGKVGGVTTGADFNLTNIADIANAIATTSGSGQTTTVDQNFANTLVATVTDKFGNPVQGSTVTFSVPGSGASGVLVANTAVTDAAGKASIVIKANTKSGSFTTTGKVGTVTTGANFNLTNLADVANSIATTSGSGQTTTVDQNFANNLVATVTDKFGNPVQGSTVTFSVPGSGASGVFVSNTAVTDAAGKVSIGIKANTKSGSFTTTGKVGTIATGADFNLTNLADVANSIATTSGSGQTATVDQNFSNNLVATVTDKFGNPVQGSTVTFSLPGSGASGVFGLNSAVTDADGKASIGIKANTKAGSFTTTGKVGGVTTGADFKLTNIADVASLIVATSGSGQTTTVDQNFSNNLVATVTDKFGNPIAGSTVTFSVPGSGASGILGSNTPLTTNAAGEVSIGIKANTKSGSFTTTGKVGTIATGADFNLTNTADLPNSIVTTSGSGQIATVDQNFATNLVATVTDKFGNPVKGSTVTFSLPGSGASGVFGSNSAVTDAAGEVSIGIKANTKPGSFTTTGKVGTVTTGADFKLTNIADVASLIVATSGSGQTTTVDQNFANNLVATVTDKFGNPIAGSTVIFSVPGSGASGTLGSNTPLTTNAAGEVSISIKANTKSGNFAATGKIGTMTTGANFTLTNTADVANSIVTTSGSGQTTTVDQNFANNLVATVTDRFGNPVQGSTVTFSLPTTTGANGVFGSNTAVTDAAGKVSIGIKANTKPGSFTTTGKVDTLTIGADFTLTNLTGAASSIVVNSGSGQTTTVDQNFANNLVATVTDKFGNPIAGSTVTFSVPGSGASGVFGSNSAVTDGSGTVSIGIKANTKSGAFRATGNVGGVTTGADFDLTNTAEAANSIVTSGGSNQLLIISQRSTQALQTQILDRFGNPVPNTSVTFILPIGGASGSFANGSNRMTATTNANGIAILNFIANSLSGTYNAIAQIELPTGLKTTQFTLTNSIKIPYLELKKTPNPAPTIVPIKPILCVVRQGGSSVSDAYKGLPSCGKGSTQGKAIVPQSRRSDAPQSRRSDR